MRYGGLSCNMNVTNILRSVSGMVYVRTDVMEDVTRQCRVPLCQPQAHVEKEQTNQSRVTDMGCILAGSSCLLLALDAKTFVRWQIEKPLSIAIEQDVQKREDPSNTCCDMQAKLQG